MINAALNKRSDHCCRQLGITHTAHGLKLPVTKVRQGLGQIKATVSGETGQQDTLKIQSGGLTTCTSVSEAHCWLPLIFRKTTMLMTYSKVSTRNNAKSVLTSSIAVISSTASVITDSAARWVNSTTGTSL